MIAWFGCGAGPPFLAIIFSAPRASRKKRSPVGPTPRGSRKSHPPARRPPVDPAAVGPTRDLFSAGRKDRWKKRRREGGPRSKTCNKPRPAHKRFWEWFCSIPKVLPSAPKRAQSPMRPQGIPEASAGNGPDEAASAQATEGCPTIDRSHNSTPSHRTARTVGKRQSIGKRNPIDQPCLSPFPSLPIGRSFWGTETSRSPTGFAFSVTYLDTSATILTL